MQINLILAITMFIILFFVFPTLSIIIFFNKPKTLKVIAITSFVVYLMLLSVLVFGKVSITKQYVKIDFSNSASWFSLNFLWFNLGKDNIVYNIVMLFPVSAFVYGVFKDKIFLRTVLISFIISFCIEFFQFVLPVLRTTEVFDILANVLSGIIGFCYFSLIYYVSKKVYNKSKNKNISQEQNQLQDQNRN